MPRAFALLDNAERSIPVKQYYFNLRKGDVVSRDRIGMHLPDLDAARAEALRMWQDVVEIARHSGEAMADAEIQIADSSGEIVLAIALGEQRRFLKSQASDQERPPALARGERVCESPSLHEEKVESSEAQVGPEPEPTFDALVNRAVLENRIARAERMVAMGERHIARQREIVRTLRRGHGFLDRRVSEQLLTAFECSLASEQHYLSHLLRERVRPLAA